jgi:hypothetical protein
MRSQHISGVEWTLAVAALAWLAFAALGPVVMQPVAYHDFADQRTLWQVPFAMDVLSNAAFALAGIAGIRSLRRLPARRVTNMQRAMAMLFFTGLLLTAAGSAWYHAQPDDATLAVDRSGMAVAIAGILGFAIACHVSERAAAIAGPAVLLLGAWAANAWTGTGNLMPWLTLQAAGLAVLAWLALVRRRPGAPDVRWSLVIMAYAVAKLFELEDHQLYEFTNGLVGGHALKHVVAALAAAPVIGAFGELRRRGVRAQRVRIQFRRPGADSNLS